MAHGPHLANARRWLGPMLVVIVLCLCLRTSPGSGTDLFRPALWAEDGTVLVAESRALGVTSLWEPVGGYLLFVPRLAAWPAAWLPLSFTPAAFHLAWLCVCTAWAWLTFGRLRALGTSAAVGLWAVAALLLQPQAGEIFFSLTNSQWFAGSALVTWLLCPWPTRVRWWHLLLLLTLGLTGPFSLLTVPLLVIRAALLRDHASHWPMYVVAALAALVQGVEVVTAVRVMADTGLPSLRDWVRAYGRFLTFGGQRPLALAAAVVFWASIPWRVDGVWQLAHGQRGPEQRHDGHAWLLMAAGLTFMTAAFLRDDLTRMSPVVAPDGVAGGSRYYFLPYTLLLLGALCAARRAPRRRIAILAAFSLAGAATLVRSPHVDQQWLAHVALARAVPAVLIPINPRIAAVPGFHAPAGYAFVGAPHTRVSLEPPTTSPHPLPLAETCPGSRYVGLDVHLRRSGAGWVQVTWGARSTPESHALLRYAPAGESRVLFAMPRPAADDTASLHAPGNDDVEVTSISALCLS